MFYFGSPEDNASLIVKGLVHDSTGPELADKPLDEMTVSELKIANAYLYMAVSRMFQAGDFDQEEYRHLLSWYRMAFTRQAKYDMEFRRFVVSPGYTPPDGHARKDKYLEVITSLES